MTSGPDIVLGVSRAADAVKQREAMARLQRMSATPTTEVASSTTNAAAAPTDWETELRRAATGSANEPSAPHVTSSAPHIAATHTNAAKSADADDKKKEVYTQFESVLLQNMVEAMMPQDSQAMFGTGTAGGMWKSMLAEKIAAEIARSGAIGIAKQIAAGPSASSAITSATRAKVGDA
jgi:peptidoglycan hydrolase FlgJ